jgi:hypothetical protein
MDPPCGRSEPWVAEIEMATADHAGQWTVEVRIPLSAFGQTPSRQTVWGFNITRFDLENQEYSTWSGAIRNAYDPLSLGNLVLP